MAFPEIKYSTFFSQALHTSPLHVSKVSSATTGDLFVMWMGTDAGTGGTMSAAAADPNMQIIQGTHNYCASAVWYKVMSASDSAQTEGGFHFTWNYSSRASCLYIAWIRDGTFDPSNPVGAFETLQGEIGSTTGTTVTQSLLPTTNETLNYYFATTDHEGSLSYSTALSLTIDGYSNVTPGVTNISTKVGHASVTTAATSKVTWVRVGGSGSGFWSPLAISINPAGDSNTLDASPLVGSVTIDGKAPTADFSSYVPAEFDALVATTTVNGHNPTADFATVISQDFAPDVATLSVDGQLPTFDLELFQDFDLVVDTLSINGHNPTVGFVSAGALDAEPLTGTLTIAGAQPTAAFETKPLLTFEPDVATTTINGHNPTEAFTTSIPKTFEPDVSTLSISGPAPGADLSSDAVKNISGITGTLTIAGAAPTADFVLDYPLDFSPTTGDYTINGHNPTAQLIRLLAKGFSFVTGTTTIDGHNPTTDFAQNIPKSFSPSVGTISLDGQAPDFYQIHPVDFTGVAGSVSVNGHAPSVSFLEGIVRTFTPAVASLAIDGQLVTFAIGGLPQNFSNITYNMGVFGCGPTVEFINHILEVAPETGTYTINGKLATLKVELFQTIELDVATLDVNGHNPDVYWVLPQTFEPNNSTISIDGAKPTFDYTTILRPRPEVAGSIVITGQAPVILTELVNYWNPETDGSSTWVASTDGSSGWTDRTDGSSAWTDS